MYLTIKGSSIEAIADALSDIKMLMEDGHVHGSDEYFGEIVAWDLNTFQK